MGKLIELKDLSVILKEKELYKNVNFTLNEGERYIFLGPNGIGKTLLLELMFHGFNKQMASQYDDLNITGDIINGNGESLLNPDVNRVISYVSQNEDFFERMTVKQLCESACHGVEIDLDENKLDYLLDKFSLSGKKNVKAKNNLSFGEGKIVHIISKLLKLEATNILFLDEPLNHLSFKNSMVFNEILLEETKKNPLLSIIMVSHCRAMSFTDKAIVYDSRNCDIIVKPYKSYDCFSLDDYCNCF